MKTEELKDRTKEFAHRCVNLALSLQETQLGKHKTIFNNQYAIFNLNGCYLLFVQKNSEEKKLNNEY